LVKQAVVEGRLFELLEMRARSHPTLMQAFRRMLSDEQLVKSMELHTPMSKKRGLALYDSLSLRRPEIRRAVETLAKLDTNPDRRTTALLIPHRVAVAKKADEILAKVARHVGLSRVLLMAYHSPLGVVPFQLARTYPFSQMTYPKSLLEDAQARIFELSKEALSRSGVAEAILLKWGKHPPASFVRAFVLRLNEELPHLKTSVIEV